ncbi:glycosyltransferase family 2 protein [Flavobacterium sp. F-380]|uniref:Glycosyltransferase family 2 protein n=1 Tax=Flavobacterium kayseriense TaxID=2764714 RepID=A0ABR7J7C6_9FLAO|nr:glycosyltransferase family 2 protein [Flavobacterium kayseriense]MBC5841440.1 glycosyltransferase family 2 protein [Flavobacterium kayseriense]MBC5847968.1 glycosyltransferase family 2 protein [Flavobacterium kayseriense]
MVNKPLVSVIIPVYNCEDFISETLDSIINQTYDNWECVLIDDESTDNVYLILENYKRKDNRFRVFRRPCELKKGANSCRNFGLKISNGQYIKWFDCDDIMLPSHLQLSYSTLISNNYDFVVTDSINFDHDTGDFLKSPYDFDKTNVCITAENLAFSTIGWITNDFFANRKFISNFKFNEDITTLGDEVNFFLRLVHQPHKSFFINSIQTFRRVHSNSITNINNIKSDKYIYHITIFKIQTAIDLVQFNNKKLIRWYLSGYMQYGFKLALSKQNVPCIKKASKLILKYYSINNALAFLIAIVAAKYLGKGYNILKYSRS